MMLLLNAPVLCANAQSDKQKAKELGARAVKLEDEGRVDEAMPLLDEAQKLAPDDYNYPYEIAYCYRVKENYNKGIEVMQKVMTFPDIREECYQMLGDLYDLNGDSTMALRSFADGLQKFPNAGSLYLETGNVYFLREQFLTALPWYEKGIEVDPAYPSNYYRAAQIYTSSSESIWGMIYGELFMNLERNSRRTSDMSSWLYKTYKSNIVIKSKDSMEVHFCQNHQMEIDENTIKQGKEMRLPFSLMYEPLLIMSMSFNDTIDVAALCNMRKKFISLYYEKDFNKKYPNVLFEYQHTIEKAGHIDAYNHWVLMKGNEDAFVKWKDSHSSEWESFIKWFQANPIEITTANEFVRSKA